jgi:hypothetical protein
MENEWERYRKIIQQLERIPLVRPADDFTQQVMGQLPELKFGMMDKIRRYLLQPRQASIDHRTISSLLCRVSHH